MNPAGKKPTVIIAAIVIVILGLIAYWYWGTKKAVAPRVQTSAQPPAGSSIGKTDLGSEVYAKSKNPIGGKLPETVAPVAPNPVKGIYKNPFE